MICIWIVGSAALYWFCSKLKKVVIDYSGKVLISNYLQVIEVRAEDISQISDGTDFFSSMFVWFALQRPSEFGQKIIFQPRMVTGPDRSGLHPILKELQDFVSLAKERAGG